MPILTGTLRALGYLQNMGIEKITFTDGTHSAELVLSELIAKGQRRKSMSSPWVGEYPDPERRSHRFLIIIHNAPPVLSNRGLTYIIDFQLRPATVSRWRRWASASPLWG